MNRFTALSKLTKAYHTFLSIAVLLSLSAFAFQVSKFNSHHLDIMAKVNQGLFSIMASGGALSHDKSNKTFSVQCHVKSDKERTLCGLVVELSTQSRSGLSLENFSELHLHLLTQSNLPNYKQRTRIFIKSQIDPTETELIKTARFKYHAVRVTGNGDIIVPISRFKVETWWEDMNNVPFDLAYIDMRSVVSLEFFINDMPIKKTGVYRIEISKLALFGKIIKDDEFYKILALCWLLISGGLFFRYLYVKLIDYRKLKKQALHDSHCSLLNTYGFNLLYANLAGEKATLYRIRIINWYTLVRHFDLLSAHDLLKRVVERSQSIFSADLLLGSRLANDDLLFIKKGERFSHDKEAMFINSLLSPIRVAELGDLCLDIKIGVSEEASLPEEPQEGLDRTEVSIQAIFHDEARLQVYTSEVNRAAENRAHIESQIKLALEQDEFYLLYMPIFDSLAQKIVGVEALLRCTLPDLRDISPEIYISIAEASGLIREIDLMVIEKALKDFSAASFEADFKLSMNISSKELLDTSFINHFVELVEESGVPATSLCLEVTETFLLDVDTMAIKTIEDIREIGCKVSLDDFGTGYTSFQQLVHFPVDEIKIDRSFVSEIGSSGYDAIINSLFSIASAYKYSVVAEGVESIEMYQSLQQKGCRFFQGYYISKPVSLAAIALLDEKIAKEGL